MRLPSRHYRHFADRRGGVRRVRSICHGDARNPASCLPLQPRNDILNPIYKFTSTHAARAHRGLHVPSAPLSRRTPACPGARAPGGEGPALNTCRDALVTDVLSLRLPGLLQTPRGSLPVSPPGASAAQVTQGDSRSAHPSDCGKQRESENAAKCGCLLLSRSRLPNVMQESVGFCVSSEVLAWFPIFPVTLSPSRGPGEVW